MESLEEHMHSVVAHETTRPSQITHSTTTKRTINTNAQEVRDKMRILCACKYRNTKLPTQ